MHLEQFLNDDLYDEVWLREQKERREKPTGPTAAGLTDVDRLEMQVEKLRLVSRALCELLIESTGLTEDQLLAKIDEIDLRAGSKDGQMSARAEKCPECGRTAGLGRVRCQYCGAPVTGAQGLDAKI